MSARTEIEAPDNTSEPGSPKARKPLHVRRRLLLAAFLFLGIEGLVFRSGLYSVIVYPDSTTGNVEKLLRNERIRPKPDPNQVLCVGDSRMSLRPKVANELTGETGYTFASVGLGGTTARCWYYMLRDLEPSSGRYAAVIVPVWDYVDEDQAGEPFNHELDLHYIVGRLRFTDIPEFVSSYTKPDIRWKMLLGSTLKGFTYKQDFIDLVRHPRARYRTVMMTRESSAGWIYNYVGERRTMKGLTVDWAKDEAHFTPEMTQQQRDMVRDVLMRPLYPQTGLERAFRRYWLNRILDLYRGTRTKVVIIKLAEGPIARPYRKPLPGPTAVSELASQPNVIVLDEHLFDGLVKPELFMDAMHLNFDGATQFSQILAREVRRALGPPRKSS